MHPCKRIEIIVERSQIDRLGRLLAAAGAPDYTLIHHAGGHGDRGHRRADDVTDTDENCVFILAVEQDEVVAAVVEGVKPILQRVGGTCLVTEAVWTGS
ncbi:P-II family nitrogen regulator [Pseudohaliea rubra]|uniref:P-II family nitrogen regulator n=1 Tax=Pseudohaliea rubra TaxID=475795 RepID=UPI0026C0C23E